MNSIKSNIDSITRWFIRGWVLKSFESSPFTVNAYINDELICSQVASFHRVGLKSKKNHKSGNCGFNIYIGDKLSLKKGDEVEIRAIYEQQETVICKTTFNHPQHQNVKQAKEKSKILIVGLGKSGTTAITYKVANAFKEPVINFEPGKHKGLLDLSLHKEITSKLPVITKSLFGRNLQIDFGSISKIYDKKIWIIRDPRDQIISIMLYKWFHGHNPDPITFKKTLDLVRKKERDPKSISIKEIWSCSSNIDHLRKNQTHQYNSIINIFNNINESWCVFKYEDLIDEKFDELEKYLGFSISSNEINLPERFKRVARTKSYGNWKNWFTTEDIKFFKPIYSNIIKWCKFEEDWEINEDQYLNPSNGSLYMEHIFNK